jgi:hypothetical protein
MLCHRDGYLVTRETFILKARITKIYKDDIKCQFNGRFYLAATVLGETEKLNLTKKLRETKFSILIDESTDVSTNKQLAIVVRYFDQNSGQVCSKFFELIQIVTATNPEANAEHLRVYEAVLSTFKETEIPIKNIIGFASDGANVMMGEKNSVSSRLTTECPGITIMKCICHSINLCVSEACKKLPRTCEDLARNIYHFLWIYRVSQNSRIKLTGRFPW